MTAEIDEVVVRPDEGLLRMAAKAGDADAQYALLRLDEERRLQAAEAGAQTITPEEDSAATDVA